MTSAKCQVSEGCIPPTSFFMDTYSWQFLCWPVGLSVTWCSNLVRRNGRVVCAQKQNIWPIWPASYFCFFFCDILQTLWNEGAWITIPGTLESWCGSSRNQHGASRLHGMVTQRLHPHAPWGCHQLALSSGSRFRGYTREKRTTTVKISSIHVNTVINHNYMYIYNIHTILYVWLYIHTYYIHNHMILYTYQ